MQAIGVDAGEKCVQKAEVDLRILKTLIKLIPVPLLANGVLANFVLDNTEHSEER